MNTEVRVRTSTGVRRLTVGDAFIQSLSTEEQQNANSISLFVASWIGLLSDSPLSADQKPYRLYRTFFEKLRREGVKNTVISYSDLAHRFVSNMNTMGTSTLMGAWISDFKDTPVFKEYLEAYRTENIDLIRYIYTFLNFGKKMEYESEAFNATAFRGWTDVEGRLARLVLNNDDVASLRLIIGTALPVFEISNFKPKFGPGSVAERKVGRRILKLRQFRYDAVIDRVFFKGHTGKYGMGEESGLAVEKIIPDPTRWAPDKGISTRIARLMFVPKNVKTSRSICMEPNVLMYFQQGVLGTILELLSKSMLRTSVKLDDQGWNRGLCQRGSATCDLDSLDLSSASDSLSLELVKRVFPTSWLVPMLATRSRFVELPDGDCIPVFKFAPMGSALCFPTQCIIFWAVCMYAAALYTYENSAVSEPFSQWLTRERVRKIYRLFGRKTDRTEGLTDLGIYGDDIVVDARLTPIVKAILSRLGFQVNNEKSFTGSQAFRESCGGYYLGGYDITPLYYRVKNVRDVTNPEHVASTIHLINECWRRGFKTVYRLHKHLILGWNVPRSLRNKASEKNPIPFTTDPETFGILCTEPANSHLQRRYNKDLQRHEVRAWTAVWTERYEAGDELCSALDSYQYLQHWPGPVGRKEPYESIQSWRLNKTTTSIEGLKTLTDLAIWYQSDEDKPSSSRWDTGSPGLRWRWIPEE